MMLPEQLSATRQLQAQLELFRTLTTQAFANAAQLLALNLDATRATFEQSSAAVKQLMTVRDPRDLLAFGTQTEQQFQYMMNYGREFFSIASGARMTIPTNARPPQLALAAAIPAAYAAPAQAAEPAAHTVMAAAADAVEQAMPAAAAAPAALQAVSEAGTETPEDQAAVAGAARASNKVVVAAETEPQPEPVAKAKPIASAVGKMAAQPGAPSHPLASPVPAAGAEVEIPPIKPIEASPPPAPVSGTPAIVAKAAQPAPKANRRKTER